MDSHNHLGVKQVFCGAKAPPASTAPSRPLFPPGDTQHGMSPPRLTGTGQGEVGAGPGEGEAQAALRAWARDLVNLRKYPSLTLRCPHAFL